MARVRVEANRRFPVAVPSGAPTVRAVHPARLFLPAALLAAVLCVASLVGSPRVAHAQARTYTLTDLGTLGGTYSAASAINRSGQVVGGSTLPGDETLHPFLYADGRMVDLGTLSGSGFASSINAQGQVVGSYATESEQVRPFLFTPGVGLTDLTSRGLSRDGPRDIIVNDLSELGLFAGIFGPNAVSPFARGFLFGPGPSVRPLVELFGALTSEAHAVNNNGLVAGGCAFPSGAFRAVRFEGSGGRPVDLGTFPNGELSFAYGINEAGAVVGGATVDAANTIVHAFRKNFDGGLIDLGTTGGFPSSIAYAINDNGSIVGNLYRGDPATEPPARAFLHTPDRGMVDLNTLVDPGSGMTLETAFAINDAGQIVGSAITAERETHAYLLTPRPAPVVNVVATVPQALEAGRVKGEFTFSRSADTDLSAPLTVAYLPGGSATGGVQYQILPGFITIPAGATAARVKVKPLARDGFPGTATVKVTVQPGARYNVGPAAKAKVKVIGEP